MQKTKPKIVLLPGMDGTGILFEPFLECAPDDVDISFIKLPQNKDYKYTDYAKYISQQIGSDPTIIVAESYSGMIAYELLHTQKCDIRHILFAASFLSRPTKLAALLKPIPIQLLRLFLKFRFMIGFVLFGRYKTSKLLDLFYQALSDIPDSTLKNRINQVANLEIPKNIIKIPCSYIRPANDNLVSKTAINIIESKCDTLDRYDVDGTHFILQTNPKDCWHIIKRIIA